MVQTIKTDTQKLSKRAMDGVHHLRGPQQWLKRLNCFERNLGLGTADLELLHAWD